MEEELVAVILATSPIPSSRPDLNASDKATVRRTHRRLGQCAGCHERPARSTASHEHVLPAVVGEGLLIEATEERFEL